jgi:predicted nucleic acid-binding protein
MIYFDAAYIVKCYLPERGHQAVRGLLESHGAAACCSLGRVEFTAAIHRAVREGRIPDKARTNVFSVLSRDENAGVWGWLALAPELVEAATQALRSVPTRTVIRAADALHLVCARENGYRQVYTNDRHMLGAASYFGVQAVNVIV